MYNPENGLYAVMRLLYNAKWLGSNNEYANIMYDFRYYYRIKPKHVLVAKLSGGHSIGDVPFDGYQTFGMRSNLRGYATGKYRGKNMIGAQIEYRPFRTFSLDQSSSMVLQLNFGVDIPHSAATVIMMGRKTPELGPVWYIGLKTAFDWRYYW